MPSLISVLRMYIETLDLGLKYCPFYEPQHKTSRRTISEEIYCKQDFKPYHQENMSVQ